MIEHIVSSFKGNATSKGAACKTVDYLKEFCSNLPKHFPGLESIEPIEDRTYRWKIKFGEAPEDAFTLDAITRFEVQSNQILIIPDYNRGDAVISGRWRILPAKNNSRVELEVAMEIPPGYNPEKREPVGLHIKKEMPKRWQKYMESLSVALSS